MTEPSDDELYRGAIDRMYEREDAETREWCPFPRASKECITWHVTHVFGAPLETEVSN